MFFLQVMAMATCLSSACLWRIPPLWGIVGIQRNSSALLTVGRSVVQEVSGHLTLAFHLYEPSTLQLVTFTGQHLVQICSHLQNIQ